MRWDESRAVLLRWCVLALVVGVFWGMSAGAEAVAPSIVSVKGESEQSQSVVVRWDRVHRRAHLRFEVLMRCRLLSSSGAFDREYDWSPASTFVVRPRRWVPLSRDGRIAARYTRRFRHHWSQASDELDGVTNFSDERLAVSVAFRANLSDPARASG